MLPKLEGIENILGVDRRVRLVDRLVGGVEPMLVKCIERHVPPASAAPLVDDEIPCHMEKERAHALNLLVITQVLPEAQEGLLDNVFGGCVIGHLTVTVPQEHPGVLEVRVHEFLRVPVVIDVVHGDKGMDCIKRRRAHPLRSATQDPISEDIKNGFCLQKKLDYYLKLNTRMLQERHSLSTLSAR